MLDAALLMARALALAEQARGQTSPNPMVGAIVVARDGRIVGTGYHQRAGEPHAEVIALRQAGDLARGGTLVCTLEPCSHHGRTPPCTDRVIASGISRVVIGSLDPNPRAAGGVAILRAHGIDVEVGVLAEAANRLNVAFFTAIREGRPWVCAKVAVTSNGCVALRAGERSALSGPEANAATHRLRAEVDAVAIGVGTLLVDSPLLTCRGVARERPLTRVVFDRQLRTPPTAPLLETLDHGPVLVVTDTATLRASTDRARVLEQAGATIVPVDGGRLDAAMRALLGVGVQSILLEGGPTLHAAAFAARVVDRVRMIVTGHQAGPTGVPWVSPEVFDPAALFDIRVTPYGADVVIEGDVYRID